MRHLYVSLICVINMRHLYASSICVILPKNVIDIIHALIFRPARYVIAWGDVLTFLPINMLRTLTLPALLLVLQVELVANSII